MAAVYANKFSIEASDIVRVVFSDERAKIGGSLPASISTASEVVMTKANAVELARLILKVVAQ